MNDIGIADWPSGEDMEMEDDNRVMAENKGY